MIESDNKLTYALKAYNKHLFKTTKQTGFEKFPNSIAVKKVIFDFYFSVSHYIKLW